MGNDIENKKDLNLGAVVACYNREEYIGPYLDMMLEHEVDCIVNLSDKPWTHGGTQERIQVDKTEDILNRFFPSVKVNKRTFSHHKDSLNYGIDNFKEYDRVFILDCDIFLTNEDWGKMVDFLKEDMDVFKVNFEKMIIEYYYDWRYGKAAIPGGHPPIVAIKPKVRAKNMIHTSDMSDREIVWDIEGPKLHHFRFAKQHGSGKHLYDEPVTNLHDYKPAPEEIINRLKKWQEILKTL